MSEGLLIVTGIAEVVTFILFLYKTTRSSGIDKGKMETVINEIRKNCEQRKEVCGSFNSRLDDLEEVENKIVRVEERMEIMHDMISELYSHFLKKGLGGNG